MAEDKKKKYVSDYTHLMEEWDWEKNERENLDPQKLTYGSVKLASVYDKLKTKINLNLTR